MLTLDEFIQAAPAGKILKNQYVKHPDFSGIYVRYNEQRYINGEMVSNVLDIANITARKPGKGAFSKLIVDLRQKHPLLVFYVECILNPRFADKLERMGFTYNKVGENYTDSMYLLPNQELKE